MPNVLISILLLALSVATTTHSSPTDGAISLQREATFSNEASPPPLPSSFYGLVILDEALPSAAGVVTAWIGDEMVARTTTFLYNGEVYYRIDVPDDDPDTSAIEGGVPSTVIRFTIDNIPATPNVLWIVGANRRLDLAPAQRHRQQPDEANQLCAYGDSSHGPSKRETDNGRGSRQAVEELGRM